MAETFAWPEGSVYLWTGATTASAVVAYAEHVYGTLLYGIDNFRTLDGTYHNLWTGQRADVYVGAFYTTDAQQLQVIADAQTAIHAHLKHSGLAGSAGLFLYSGAIDSVQLQGAAGDVYRFSLQFHANNWSAY
jgi:hypothetical protein